MRLLNVLFLAVFSLLIFTSCADGEKDKTREAARQSLPQATPAPATSNSSNPNAVTITGNTVPHYQCPKKCDGGVGDTSGACPVCGTEMAHNAAFHNTQNNTNTTSNTSTPAQPTNPSPAQNAAGVYHFICSNGCAGGAGSAGSCATCGGALAHNAEYHN